MCLFIFHVFFFFNDTATTEIYTLSLHDALPILSARSVRTRNPEVEFFFVIELAVKLHSDRAKRNHNRAVTSDFRDRKSTRLNSSHVRSSYAVFCLKKKEQSAI